MAHLTNYTFFYQRCSSIQKHIAFKLCQPLRPPFFHRKLITSYCHPVNMAKFLRAAPEAVVCRCSSK